MSARRRKPGRSPVLLHDTAASVRRYPRSTVAQVAMDTGYSESDVRVALVVLHARGLVSRTSRTCMLSRFSLTPEGRQFAEGWPS